MLADCILSRADILLSGLSLGEPSWILMEQYLIHRSLLSLQFPHQDYCYFIHACSNNLLFLCSLVVCNLFASKKPSFPVIVIRGRNLLMFQRIWSQSIDPPTKKSKWTLPMATLLHHTLLDPKSWKHLMDLIFGITWTSLITGLRPKE